MWFRRLPELPTAANHAAVILVDLGTGTVPGKHLGSGTHFCFTFIVTPLRDCLQPTALCRDLHQKLLLRCLGASSLDALSVDALHALIKDRAGSHLMEASGGRWGLL